MKWDDIDTSAVSLDILPEEARDIATLIGVESYMRLVMEHGGRSLYIHKLDQVRRSIRDDQIRREFDGTNHGELCKKWDLSEKQIRQILADRRYKQTSLFDNDTPPADRAAS